MADSHSGKTIGVINYGMGNIRSVVNAFCAIGVNCSVINTPNEASEATHLVLPGVGGFRDGMKALERQGFVAALEKLVVTRPLLGICLGMQLLCRSSEEYGDHEGLSLFPGIVCRLRPENDLRVPHVGWNDVHIRGGGKLFRGSERNGEPESFYFVHSFHVVPDEVANLTAVAHYGIDVTASIEHNNLFGVQFHPEKSQRNGLKLLRRFVEC